MTHKQQIHAWFMPEEKSISIGQEEHLLQILDQQEKKRLARYRQDQDKRLFLQSRVLLRNALSMLTDVEPATWHFETTGQGRPVIAEPILSPPLSISISHTPGMVACLVSPGSNCGIDVESTRLTSNLEKLSQKVLSVEEKIEWDSLSPEEKIRRFYECWTLKEAYLKAVGIGLSVSLKEISFSFDKDQSNLTKVPAGLGLEGWIFRLLQPSLEHHAAIAWRADRPLELVMHQGELENLFSHKK